MAARNSSTLLAASTHLIVVAVGLLCVGLLAHFVAGGHEIGRTL